ncbi:MAG: spermidine synthase, partial [Oscillospiraceae bacterium]|nr:spermidine synthase [Oscillospiraceae bacterium]
MDLWFSEYHTKTVRFSIKVTKQLFSEDSGIQRIDVFDSTEFGR